MPSRVVGVILSCVVLANDHVGGQVKNEARIAREGVLKQITQLVFQNDGILRIQTFNFGFVRRRVQINANNCRLSLALSSLAYTSQLRPSDCFL